MDYGTVLFSKLVLQLHDCQKLHIASIFFFVSPEPIKTISFLLGQ